jgi:hypothetical protein
VLLGIMRKVVQSPPRSPEPVSRPIHGSIDVL